jgi:hypothetical protein
MYIQESEERRECLHQAMILPRKSKTAKRDGSNKSWSFDETIYVGREEIIRLANCVKSMEDLVNLLLQDISRLHYWHQ